MIALFEHETPATFPADFIPALLGEIAALLEALTNTGEEGAIDLRSLPLSEADRLKLEDLLGHGEVEARVQVAGETLVWETAFSGVWWVRHKSAEGKVIAEQIAITRLPDILQTPGEDAKAALPRLQKLARKTGASTPLTGDSQHREAGS